MSEHTVVRNPFSANRPQAPSNGKLFTPRVDIFETPTELLLHVDLPGASAYDIDLRYERGELVLSAKVPAASSPGQPVLEEYETGDFFRAFQIHENIDPGKIEAEYKNGVLTIHLPKQESAKPKQVQIRAG